MKKNEIFISYVTIFKCHHSDPYHDGSNRNFLEKSYLKNLKYCFCMKKENRRLQLLY